MPSITRRHFLEESMIAMAASAAASAAPSVRAGEEGSKSAGETIHHAILGCRIRGQAHAKAFASQPGVEVTYVCDPDRQLANELATSLEQQQGRRPKEVQDLREVFDDPSVNTVSIASPNHWHALSAIWAMQAGKDVYVEKPVSNTVREGRRMVQVARETGRICQAGTQNRSSGSIAAAGKYIRAGKLGDVTLARTIIYGRRGAIGKRGVYEVPAHVDYNLWLGPGTQETLTRPRLHYDWHWVWDTGNGELGNNNIHYIDIVRWVTGLTGTGDSVISIGGRLGYEDAGQTPNTQMVVHTFGKLNVIQEVRGLKSDPFSDKFKSGWVVHGTEGFIAGSSRFDPNGKLVETFQGPGENHFVNFIEAVRNGRREDLNAEILEGHQSTALCHVGNISHRLGETASPSEIQRRLEGYDLNEEASNTLTRMVAHLRSNDVDLNATPLTVGPFLKLDSKRERFIDHQAANQLLTRTYRQPFVVPGIDEV
jgi:predicted dehydrogenase